MADFLDKVQMFQFQKVRLKDDAQIRNLNSNTTFQFQKVRLKAIFERLFEVGISSFNSKRFD